MSGLVSVCVHAGRTATETSRCSVGGFATSRIDRSGFGELASRDLRELFVWTVSNFEHVMPNWYPVVGGPWFKNRKYIYEDVKCTVCIADSPDLCHCGQPNRRTAHVCEYTPTITSASLLILRQ